MSRTSRNQSFVNFLQIIAAFVYIYGNRKIPNSLDSNSYAVRGRDHCARFLSRSTEKLSLRILKVNDAMLSSDLALKLSFLYFSVAIVCRSGNDVSASIHHPFIISFDLRHPNDERKPFEDFVAYRIIAKQTFVDHVLELTRGTLERYFTATADLESNVLSCWSKYATLENR